MSANDERGFLRWVYERLYGRYGPQHWWPGETQLEIIIGAVLTQNTAWTNVARAIGNLKALGLLDLDRLLLASEEQVKEAIRPSGYYNLKYRRLMSVLRYLHAKDSDWTYFQKAPLEQLRRELLSIWGVGPETADSILLYAFGRPVFVVDAYTRRILTRLGRTWAASAPYAEVQRYFMVHLAEDVRLLNEYHALIVVHGKQTCRKKPLCVACCLATRCPEGVSLLRVQGDGQPYNS